MGIKNLLHINSSHFLCLYSLPLILNKEGNNEDIFCSAHLISTKKIQNMTNINIPLFKMQQQGINTDCSFVFKNCNQEKIIHAHKLILSSISPYFESQFKSEWGGNEPIPVTTFQHETFDKMIEIIYLSHVSFDTLDEAINLYEGAHFYQIEGLLDSLRYEIPRFWKHQKTIKISKMVNTVLKYQDYMLMQFIEKCFCANATQILQDEDWFNYILQQR